MDFLLGIKNEIIKPLGNIHSTFLNKYLAYKNGISQLEEEYEENVKILNDSKNNFYKSVRDVEDCKINFEYKKQNNNDLSTEYKKKEDYSSSLFAASFPSANPLDTSFAIEPAAVATVGVISLTVSLTTGIAC